MYQNIIRELEAVPGGPEVLTDEPMSRHTTFRIGGNADVFVTPRNIMQTVEVLRIVQKSGFHFFVIGNGSNLLVSDSGYRGIVVRIFRGPGDIRVDGERIEAEAGASLSAVAAEARESSLTGFEFASGIPGTLGGAIVMNAGAYGGEMKDVVKSAKVLTREGEVISLTADELAFGYRTSIIPKEDYVVLSAEILLKKGDQDSIRAKMKELQERRITKQPLEYPSAGSTFKRPEGYFAGKLIDDAGLRGFRVGDAMVSDKHCGFVINTGKASASDVRLLMKKVSDKVYENSGVHLEPEVRLLGDF